MTWMNTSRAGYLALAMALACSRAATVGQSTAVTRDDTMEAPRDFARSDRILAAEFTQVRGSSAAHAVRQLRPQFLYSSQRGPARLAQQLPAVYVNGQHVGGIEALEIIGLQTVEEIRHVDPTAAKSMFGSYCPCDGGVIMVQMRRGELGR